MYFTPASRLDIRYFTRLTVMPVAEQVRREDLAAIGEADLGVLDAIRAGLALFVFGAGRVVNRQACRELLVIIEVAKRSPQAELAGGRQPLQHVRLRVERVIHLRRADAERAQVVRDHRHVLELRRELAFEPEAGRIGAAEELVGDEAIVHAQPVRELALRAANARERRDPPAKRHVLVEHIADVPARPRPAPDRPATVFADHT